MGIITFMKQIINVFVLTTVLFITGTTSFAQEPDRQADTVQYDFSTFTINELEVGGPEYTEQDIIRAFGQPDSVWYEFEGAEKTYMYERKIKVLNKEVGTGDYYTQITLMSNPGSIICAFVADTSSVMNSYIRVGDPASKVYDMGGRVKDDGSGHIRWCPSGLGNADWIVCPEITYDKDGKITSFGICIL